MKTALSVSLIILFYTIAPRAEANPAQSATATPVSATQTPIQKNIEAYLRHLYAFGPDVLLVVGVPKETAVDGLLETTINLTIGENKQTVKFYVSKDGKFLFRGEMSDMTKDPLVESRSQIQGKDAPSLGDPKAVVTLV